MAFASTIILNIGVGAILVGFGVAALLAMANWLGWPSRHGRKLFYGALALSTILVVSLLILQPLRFGSGGGGTFESAPDVEYGPQRR